MDIASRINELKKRSNAIILAHYYQNAEIQDIADFIGDSFELARKARDTGASTIVFCGVHFMAESAKILSPDKTVLLPAPDAGCPMADMADEEAVRALRRQHKDAAFVCYVNTSAAVKAECDVCCTSSNAALICSSVPQKEIVFLPDENLGDFVASRVKDKRFILYKGFCATHSRVTVDDFKRAREAMPDAEILVHPECRPEVVKLAGFAGSTAQIINYIKQSPNKAFIIGTEQGILHQLKKQNPDKQFYILSPKLICPNMKKTTLNDVLNSLEHPNQFEINIDPQVMERARKSLEKMLELVRQNSK
ncbi:MAG TPA: quinolinate synthase NadA [Clostridia bacterium]|nr:quinolinate synthase NadA [Clostridia bacterium]